MEFSHQPVLLEEALAALAPKPRGRYVDGTCGGGGHTRAILDQVGPQGQVLGLDRDPDAICYLEKTIASTYPNLILYQANFADLSFILADLGWEAVDGMILDLGLSSYHLEGSGRGFSFARSEVLDMRMNPEEGRSARDLVNRLPEKELADLIFKLGEERASRKIARAIVRARDREKIETTDQLAGLVRKALWKPGARPRVDPATRTFQALRLAVNQELDHLEAFLSEAPACLRLGGRLVIISFHSLEDRLVKRSLVPSGKAVDDSGSGPVLRALFKKPLRPGQLEVSANPRSRSARMRAGERIR